MKISRHWIFIGLVLLIMLACNLPASLQQPTPTVVDTGMCDLNKVKMHPTETQLPIAIVGQHLTPAPTEATPTEQNALPLADHSIVAIVQPELLPGIQDSLDHYKRDLLADGYNLIVRRDEMKTPPEVRTTLQELYSEERDLEGVLLIGDIPHAYQWVTMTFTNPNLAPTEKEAVSLQYYADLNGEFASSPDFMSPSDQPYSFDVHSGDLDWEIWVGVLPLYQSNIERSIDAINRYFEKNHAYRQGEYAIPRSFVYVDEHHAVTSLEEHESHLEGLRSGQYAWTPFSLSPEASFYFESPPADLTVEQGYEALSDGVADFFVTSAHGTWAGSGKINIDWVETNPVRTVFFWSGGCSVGNIDYPENFLTSVLYSPTSTVLIAAGKTTDAGGMGNNLDGFFGHNIATALEDGENFGQAILGHVNVPLISPWSESREFNYATPIFFGDLSLTLQQ
jgi:hypothetical protein